MNGLPPEVRDQFAALRAGPPIDAVVPGMSGASIFRVQQQPPLALRRWPQGTSLDRVRQVHSLIDLAARDCELLPKFQRIDAPNATMVTDRQGFIWELADWKPGRPLPFTATNEQIQAGAHAIARVHTSFLQGQFLQGQFLQGQSTEAPAIPTARFAMAPSPGIQARLERIEFLSKHLPQLAGQTIAGLVPREGESLLDQTRKQLLANWPRISVRLTESLLACRGSELVIQPILRDIHREHALFDEDKVAGIIDFDAIAWDSPALDLARWASSFSRFSSDSNEILDLTLAAYRAELPFPDGQSLSDGQAVPFRKLMGVLAAASSWISLANWAIWLLLERRQFADFQRVATRISRLLESTDSLTLPDVHE